MGGQKERCATGSFPEFGAIFMSSNSSRKACLENRIFALPPSYANFVSQVKAGMLLFLFEYEKRELHGVFQAESDGAINIVPNAFGGDLYPAQVKFTHLWLCSPLSEYEFRDAIRENYFSAKKFKFGLSEKQVVKLLSLFSSRKMEDQAPERQLTSGQPAQPSSSTRSKPRRVVHSDRFVDGNRVINEHNVDSKFNHSFSAVRQEDPVYRDRREVDDGRYGIHQNKQYENKIEREIVRRTSEYIGDSYTATREGMDGSGPVSDRERNQRDVDADFRPVESIRYSIEDLRSPSDVRFARSGSHETKSLLPMGHFTGNVRDAFPDARFARSCHGFEEEHYKHNVLVPENSMEYPNVFQTNPYSSSRRVSDAESFSHFSPRQSSALIQMKEPQESNVSYATTYRDSVIKDNHSYDPDISCIRYRSPSSLGIDQYSGSLQCAPDISHASDILLSCRNQSQLSCPETTITTIYSDVDGLARGRTLLPHSNQYEDYNAESLSRLASCDYPMIDSSENGSYGGISPLMPRQIRNDGRSELLTSYSFDSSYPYSSVPLEDHHEHKLPEFGNNADYAVDVPASYESQFLPGNHHSSQPKSADHRKETKLSPLAYQNSESLDVDCQKKKSSVFSRLALPPKVSRRENNRSFGNSDHGVESSVKEVMSSLYHGRYSWLKGSRESLISRDSGATVRDKKQVMQNSKSLKDPSFPLKESDSAATFKDKKPVMQNSKSLKEPLALSKDSDSGATLRDKKQVMVNSKSLEDSSALSKESDSGTSLKNTKQVMLNSKSLKDPSTLSKENSDQKDEGTPFVDFKRRSVVKKTLHDSTENSSKSGENDVSIGQRKRRKLVRPDFGRKGEANEILQRPSLEPFMVPEEVSSSRGDENKNSESAELLQGVVQTDQEGSHSKENKECESAELLHEASQTNHLGKRRLKTWKGSSSEVVTVENEAPEIPQRSSLNSSIGAAKVSPSNVDKSKICEYINMLRGTDREDNHMVDSGRLSSENISMDDNASGELQRPSPESSALKRKINLLRRTDREGKHMVDSGTLSSENLNIDGSVVGKLRRPSPESSALERNIDLCGTDCEGSKYMVDSGRLSSENFSMDVDASVNLQIPSESSIVNRNINSQRGSDCEGKCIVNSGRSASENTSVDENASGELQGPSSESSILKRDITLLRGTDCEGKNVVDKGSLASENISMDENASGKTKRPSPEPSALKRKIKLLRGTNREGKNMDDKGSVTSENTSMDENASGKLKRPSPEPTALKRKIKLLRGTNREGKNMVDKGNKTSESISGNDDASRRLQRPSSESSLLKRKTADSNASDSHVSANNICQSPDLGCQKDVSLEEGEIGSFERDSEEDRKESYEKDESSDVSFKEPGAKIDKGRSTAKDPISGGLCEGEDSASRLGVQNHSRKVTRDTARNLHKRFKTALNR